MKLIDMQSMDELEHNFDDLAKKTDVIFDQLKSSWYSFSIGSEGARHALEVFKSQYDSMLARGDASGANGLLGGTLEQAEKVLKLQREAQANDPKRSATGAVLSGNAAAHAQSMLELSRFGVTAVKDEVAAQETLVAALRDQQTIQEKIAALKREESANATKETGNAASGRNSEARRAAAESMLRMGEQAIQADRAVAEAQLAARRASIAERLNVDLDFAARERDIQTAANEAEIAALDRSGKDYVNQLAAAKNKALEITQQYQTRVAEVESKASAEAAAKDIRDLEESIREKIAATNNGEAQRLAVVDAALKAEQSRNLQDTAFYRELLTQRADITRQMAEEDAKRQETAGKQTAEDIRKSGALTLQAEKASLALRNSARKATDEELLGQSIILAEQENSIKRQALQQEIWALDRGGKDYQNKLKELQNQENQLIQQHENEITQIRQKAEEARNQRLVQIYQQTQQQMAQSLTQSIMGHQSWARALAQISEEVVSSALRRALMNATALDGEKRSEAASAARKMFLAGTKFPFPANIVMAPTLAAGAFATVMAFEGGGIVPGFGHGDVVPAMLSPGETVIPKGMTEALQRAAKSGSDSSGNHYHMTMHVHMNAQALDADGVDHVFEKHATKIQTHMERTLRKMNK